MKASRRFTLQKRSCGAVGLVTYFALLAGCESPPQAHAPIYGATRTEDVSHVVYNYPWLKEYVFLRDLQVDRAESDILRVTAQLHSREPHVSRKVYVKTDFYSAPPGDGGRVVDSTEWEPFVLEPRKRITYEVNSLVPADDFRVYVNYGQDIGKP